MCGYFHLLMKFIIIIEWTTTMSSTLKSTYSKTGVSLYTCIRGNMVSQAYPCGSLIWEETKNEIIIQQRTRKHDGEHGEKLRRGTTLSKLTTERSKLGPLLA